MLKSLRSRGLLYSTGIAINRLVPSWLFRARIFRVFELNKPSEGDPAMTDEQAGPLRFQWCDSKEDRKLASELTHYPLDANSSSHRACIAFIGDLPVGGLWIGENHFDETDLGVRILLPEQHVWLFAAFVSKTHRKQGVYRKLLRFVLSEYTDQHVLASINPTNRSSIAAHSTSIKQDLGTSCVVRVAGFALARCNGSLQLDRKTGIIKENPLKITILRR